jgi:hypothetical protein
MAPWTGQRTFSTDRFKDGDRSTHASPNTPWSLFGTPGDMATPGVAHLNNKPSPLCHWSIHAAIRNPFDGDSDSDDGHESEHIDDPDDPYADKKWLRWPFDNLERTFEEKLQAALENNSFSSLNSDDLPLALAEYQKPLAAHQRSSY